MMWGNHWASRWGRNIAKPPKRQRILRCILVSVLVVYFAKRESGCHFAVVSHTSSSIEFQVHDQAELVKVSVRVSGGDNPQNGNVEFIL